MIIQLEKNIRPEHYHQIVQRLEKIKYKYTAVQTQFQDYLVAIGKASFNIRRICIALVMTTN